MNPDALAAQSLSSDISAPWREDVTAQLHAGENVLAALQVDLDTRLHFVSGLLVLTNQRLLSRTGTDAEWQQWPFVAGLAFSHHDPPGVGRVNPFDAPDLIASWRFTLGQKFAAVGPVDPFHAQLANWDATRGISA